MPHILIKSLKVGLWVILPLIFTANNSIEVDTDKKILTAGSYVLTIPGANHLKLEGVINFETAKEPTSNGEAFTILKLNLTDHQETLGHSLGFYLSTQNNSMKKQYGQHKISGNLEGFLNNFDGVFGYANINHFGELPFFAKNGAITIDKLDDNILKGSINVVFENTNQDNFTITGNFIALKK